MLIQIIFRKEVKKMAVFKIVTSEDSILREKAIIVPKINNNILKLLDNMKDTLADAKGVGLAAPQIGISKRVIIVDIGEGLIELINPEIISKKGQDTDLEGCLSLPGIQGEVTRAEEVVVKDGILFIDKAKNIQKVN
jgi:peptide deformylase